MAPLRASHSSSRDRFNRWIDAAGDYLARHKGMLPLLGVALIVLNGLIGLAAAVLGWDDFLVFRQMCLLQIGVVLAVLGILLAWAL